MDISSGNKMYNSVGSSAKISSIINNSKSCSSIFGCTVVVAVVGVEVVVELLVVVQLVVVGVVVVASSISNSRKSWSGINSSCSKIIVLVAKFCRSHRNSVASRSCSSMRIRSSDRCEKVATIAVKW